MSQKIEPIQHGRYYHIYNRGINGEKLFRENTNYEYFLRLYEKYIEPVVDTFAYVLMPNHFHLLVRIKLEEEIPDSARPDRFRKPVRSNDRKKPYQYFSNLFNAYTKAFNKRHNRSGSLFERPFHRIEITHEKYLRHLVFYIHNNPVKHGFADTIPDYTWSSYLSIMSVKPTKLKRDSVIGWFEDRDNFRLFHQKNHAEKEIEQFLID
ncbi:MAG: hypothetical protein R6U04_05115 [Bacteroidales bacterium]